MSNFLGEWNRKALRADFKKSDQIVTAAWTGGVSALTVEKYRRLGARGRFFERLWVVLVSVLWLFILIIVPLSASFIAAEAWWLQVFSVVLWLAALYNFGILSGFLRWTRRRKR